MFQVWNHLGIKVIPRMIQKAGLQKKIITIENAIMKGILFGTVLSLFMWRKKWLFVLFGRMMLTIFGICSGIFVGCISVALAEILDTFPIFFRRLRLDIRYERMMLFAMALGKTAGALFYFCNGYGLLS